MGITCNPTGSFKGDLDKVDNKIAKAKAAKIAKKKIKKNQDADKKRVRNGGNEDERDHDMCDRRCSDRGRVVGSRKRIIFASKKKGETKK